MKPSEINILIGCEESQAVTIEFRKLGFSAFSCDIQECSGGHPEWHLQMDLFKAVKLINPTLSIIHPPCTYMSKAGARWMYPSAGIISKERYLKAMQAKEFFIRCLNLDIKYLAIENPTPLKVVDLPYESQSIQPYEFGEPFSKRTLLWLKNLPLLQSTKFINEYQPYLPSNTSGKFKGQKYSNGFSKNQKQHSKTFKGIAEAMATQWGEYILSGKTIKNVKNLQLNIFG